MIDSTLMIVKVQKPIMTNEDVPMVLIYNEDRSFQDMVPWNPMCEELFENGELKVYYAVSIVDNTMVFHHKVHNQPW